MKKKLNILLLFLHANLFIYFLVYGPENEQILSKRFKKFLKKSF
jgi:hypothetical protein